MCLLQGHLVKVVVEELEDEAILETELVDAFADGDVVLGRHGEYSGDELYLSFHLHLPDF
jgi:hypothetical protein